MHPDFETLVSHHFGELPAATGKTVAQHLISCAACRLEIERLNMSSEATSPAVPIEDTGDLLARLRSWESESTQTGNGDAVKLRIGRALAPYLGTSAVHSLMQTVRADGRDVLGYVTPLLTAFLGKRAAGNLVSHVVNQSIVAVRTDVRL